MERLDFTKVALLLFIVFGGGIGIYALLKFEPRDEAMRSAQFETIRDALTAVELPEGTDLRIPPREEWTYRSFGHIDEWSGVVVLDDGRSERAESIVVDFNVKNAPDTLRKRDWLTLSKDGARREE